MSPGLPLSQVATDSSFRIICRSHSFSPKIPVLASLNHLFFKEAHPTLETTRGPALSIPQVWQIAGHLAQHVSFPLVTKSLPGAKNMNYFPASMAAKCEHPIGSRLD